MLYILENEYLRVSVSDIGAELMSVIGKKSGYEYLWQGNPAYWGDRAPILFPICGRLTEGKYTLSGKEYKMNLHGFARHKIFAVEESTAARLVLTLREDGETLLQYPFPFVLTVTYTLDGNQFDTRLHVENTGKEMLPFSIGGHPGFNAPFAPNEDFTDYYLEFPVEARPNALYLSDTCFYTGKKNPFTLRAGKIIDLKHSLFDRDAIFLSDMPHSVSLRSKKNANAVTLSFDDAFCLGFWQKPKSDATYVCIEPWKGVPSMDGIVDDFATKKEFLHLPSGESYETGYTVTITE